MNRNSAPRVGPGVEYTLSTTAEQYLDDNWGRDYLEIQNTGTNAALIGIGAAPTAGTGRTLAAGASWNPSPAPGDQIWMMSGTLTTTVLIFGR